MKRKKDRKTNRTESFDHKQRNQSLGGGVAHCSVDSILASSPVAQVQIPPFTKIIRMNFEVAEVNQSHCFEQWTDGL